MNELSEYLIIKQIHDIHENTGKPISEIIEMDWDTFKSYKF